MGRDSCRLRTQIEQPMENVKEKFLFPLRYYVALILCFVPLRLIFMAVTGESNNSLADYLQVAWHGLQLDIAVAGYVTALPLLLTIVSLFVYMPMRKIFIVYNLFVAIIIGAAFVADISLYPFWEFKLDASFLLYLDSPSNAFASVSGAFIATRLTAFIILVALLFTLLHFITPKSMRPSRPRLLPFAGLLLAVGLLFLGIRGGVSESTNNVGKVYFSNNQFLNHSAVNPIFSFIYSIGKREDYSAAYRFFGPEELNARVEGLYKQDRAISDTLLNNSRPNVITILLEGMSCSLIESMGGIQGVTPNFDKLSKEGVLFTQCYANSYRTDRGLICSLSGYLSYPKTSVMKSAIKSQRLPSIASALREAGYHNAFLYGGDINFTNMKSYLYSTGYHELIADKDFGRENTGGHRWGFADHITFDSLLYLVKHRPQEPWHITYLTLSSHEPWTVPYNRIGDSPIANSFAYTDSCLGNFIKELKESDLWENTLVICMPDHAVSKFPKGVDQTNENRNRIPLLFTGGAVKECREIATICNQSDFPATLLAQLGLPIENFTFSRNVLSPSYDYPFAYHAFNNGISFIDSTGFTLFDLDANDIRIEKPADVTHSRATKAKAILQAAYNDFQKR